MLKTDKHSLQTVPCLDAFNTYSLHLPMVLTQNFLLKSIYLDLWIFIAIYRVPHILVGGK